MDYKHTLQEIANELGISRERVRQILNSALEKLKENKKLKEIYAGTKE